MNQLLSQIENIVRECGNIILSVKPDEMAISDKEGIGNIVTQYDGKIQEMLKHELLALIPDAAFVGEEEELHTAVLQNGYTFIVDPIDGTYNFATGWRMSAVSIALLKDGAPYLAVCYNPYADEMFTAEKGCGAYLNGTPIHVSNKRLCEGIFIAGSAPYYLELRERTTKLFGSFFAHAADFRAIGSAVIEICAIACGRVEAYYDLRLQPWDYAAAMLILQEAGGTVTTIDGNEMRFDAPSSILASNGAEDYLVYTRV